MKFMTKNKGAISIFLALVLLPMMAVASVYIEASRIKVAKSVASAAGDLTINTALTNYDNALKELYGLMAISQTDTSLKDNLADYYYNSMISAGVDKSNANTYVQKIMAEVEDKLLDDSSATDDSVVDMLSMNLVGPKFKNTTKSTTSLANPIYLKSQIIDLMKYRTPLSVGLSFLASLESFTTLGKQQDVIDQKNNYYKVQQGIIGDMQVATSYLRKYDRLATEEIKIDGADDSNVNQLKQGNGEWAGFYSSVNDQINNYIDDQKGRLWYISNNLVTQQYNAQKDTASGVNKYFNIDFKYYAKGTSAIWVDGKEVKATQVGDYGTEKNKKDVRVYPSAQDIYDIANTITDKYTGYYAVYKRIAYETVKDEKGNEKEQFKQLFNPNNDLTKISGIQWLIKYNRTIENATTNYPEALYNLFVAHNSISNAISWLKDVKPFYDERVGVLDFFKTSMGVTYDFDFTIGILDKMFALNESYGLIDSVGTTYKNATASLAKDENDFKTYMSELENLLGADPNNTSVSSVITNLQQIEEKIDEFKDLTDAARTDIKKTAIDTCNVVKNALYATKDLSKYIEGYHSTRRSVNDVNSFVYKRMKTRIDTQKLTGWEVPNAPVLEDKAQNPIPAEVDKAIENLDMIIAILEGKEEGSISEYSNNVIDSVKKIYDFNESTSIMELYKNKIAERKDFQENKIQEAINADNDIIEKLDTILKSKLTLYGNTAGVEFQYFHDAGTGYSSSLQNDLENFKTLTNPAAGMGGVFKKIYDASTKDLILDGNNEKNQDLAAGKTSDTQAKIISDNIKTWHKKLTQAKDYLTSANASLAKVAEALHPVDASHPEGGSLIKAENTWKDSTENGSIKGTTIAQQNQQEIAAVKDLFSYDEVVELQTVIKQKISTVENAISQLEAYKYAGTSLKDMKNHTDYDKALNTLTSHDLINLSLEIDKLNEKSKTVYKEALSTPTGGFKCIWNDTEKATRPQFVKNEECKFYIYLMNNFPEIVENDTASVSKESFEEDSGKKDVESKLDEVKKENEPGSKDRGNIGTTISSLKGSGFWPSSGWAGLKDDAEKENATKEAPTGLSESSESKGNDIFEFFEGLGTALKNATEDVRDYLLISDFVMRNFTHATYEIEIKYDLADKNKRDELSHMRGANLKESVYIKDGDSNIIINDKAFNEEVTKSAYLEAAVNIMGKNITPDYNSDYLAEIEYIAFGNGGVKTAYNTTYAIRFAFNTIYAFTDSSIRNGAYSLASTILCVPPATFFVPLLQIIIIAGLAFAESALDMSRLMSGIPVPIYKDDKSWILSIDNLFETILGAVKDKVVGTIKDAATNAVDKAIDSATKKINEYLELTDKELTEQIINAEGKLEGLIDDVTASIDAEIEDYADTAINQLTTLCQNAKSLIMLDDKGNKFIRYTNSDGVQLEVTPGEYVENKLNEWLATQADIGEENNLGHIVKVAAVEAIIKEGCAQQLLDQIDTLKGMAEDEAREMADNLSGQLRIIKEKVNEEVNTACDEINKYKDDVVNKINEAVGEGAEKLKSAISESINGFDFGGSDKSKTDLSFDNNNSSKASFFNFQYSDYLRLYLMMSLIINEEAAMTRIGDVIQANMRIASNNPTYTLDKAYTHVSFDVELEVKPLFIGIPETVLGKDLSSSWNKFKYHAQGGY